MRPLKTLLSLILIFLLFDISIASESIETKKESATEQKKIEASHTHDRKWFPLGGLKYDSVQKLTVSGCLCLKRSHPERIMCSHDFWIFQAEAGEGGGKLQSGIGVMYMTGAAAKLSLFQTWRDPVGVDPNQTYLGIECQFNLFILSTHIGLYGHIHGDSNDKNPLVTLGIGLGF